MDKRTTEILSRFKKSWDDTEAHYDMLFQYDGWEFLRELRVFLTELRRQNFDEKLRIGTSMHRLIFSRSIEHGLRKDQKQLVIEAFDNGNYDIMFYDFTAPGELIKKYDEFSTTELRGNQRLLNNLNKLANTVAD